MRGLHSFLLLLSINAIEPNALSLLDTASRPSPGGNTLEKVTVKGDTDAEE